MKEILINSNGERTMLYINRMDGQRITLPAVPDELEAAVAALLDYADEVKTDLETEADKLLAYVDETLTDEEKEERVELFPSWRAGSRAEAGKLCAYEGRLYRVVQTHTAQSDWTPPMTPALFSALNASDAEPLPEILDFVPPTGAHDAYSLGDKVVYNGKVYESLLNNNVWSPDDYPAGWKEVEND